MNEIFAQENKSIGGHRGWVYLFAFINPFKTEQTFLNHVDFLLCITHWFEFLIVGEGHLWCFIHIQPIQIEKYFEHKTKWFAAQTHKLATELSWSLQCPLIHPSH